MKKIYRHIKFYLKTSYKNFTRHFGMAFSAASAVAITLVLISVFLLLEENLRNFTYHIEDQLTIRVSIDTIVKEKQRKELETKIETMDGVKKVSFSSGKEELEAYKKEYGDSENLFSMYEGKASPVRDAFIVEMKDANKMNEICQAIKELKGVVDASFGGESTNVLLQTFQDVRLGSVAFIIFLVLIAVFLIGNKVKMSIYTRREEIAVMRNVGASNWFIKAPMMLEGMMIGLLGSILPIMVTIFGYQYLFDMSQGAMLTNMFQMKEAFPMTIHISGILLGIGVMVGLIGSFFSTTKYLRWKR